MTIANGMMIDAKIMLYGLLGIKSFATSGCLCNIILLLLEWDSDPHTYP
jgi:hypothetical protein